MAQEVGVLKSLVRGKKEEEKLSDEEITEEIVRKILEKYRQEGEYIPEEEESLNVEEILSSRIITHAVTPLKEYPSAAVRLLGNIYEKIKNVVDKIAQRFSGRKVLLNLDRALYAANIPLSPNQYLALSVTAGIVGGAAAFFFLPTLLLIYAPQLAIRLLPSLPIISVLIGFVVFKFVLSLPARRAAARGVIIEKELPFALRHLAVLIRSGMSLYGAMESIARAGYRGVSEEFKRTLKEISDGKTMEEALQALALRSYSRGMKRTVSQIIRALRIGGNLSDAIRRIAEDLTFEQRNKVREFAESLNLFGMIFMFVGLTFPVLLAVLNSIGHAPVGGNLLSAFAMPENVMTTIYLFAIPAFMVLYTIMVKRMDPLG